MAKEVLGLDVDGKKKFGYFNSNVKKKPVFKESNNTKFLEFIENLYKINEV